MELYELCKNKNLDIIFDSTKTTFGKEEFENKVENLIKNPDFYTTMLSNPGALNTIGKYINLFPTVEDSNYNDPFINILAQNPLLFCTPGEYCQSVINRIKKDEQR